MQEMKCSSPFRMDLEHWQAVTVFGETAVDAVLRGSKYGQRHPALASISTSPKLEGMDRRVLPGCVVWEIAGHSECLYDFFTTASENMIYPARRGEGLVLPFEVPDARRVERQDALRDFGSFCLFMAVHRGMGYKGERPPNA